MKRFIDLGFQIDEENCDDPEREFAFYCTVKCKFEEFLGSQTWATVQEFKEDVKLSGKTDQLKRFLSLIPKDLFKI